MRPTAAACTYICLALVIGIPIVAGRVAAEELRYGRLDSYCPFTCDISKDGQYGLVVDIFKAVTAMNGMTYRDVEVPSNRKYIALDADVSNVTTVWSTNRKAISSVVLAKEAIVASRWATATKNDADFTFRKLDDLDRVRLIASSTLDHSQEFAGYLATGTESNRVIILHGMDIENRALQMLLLGRGYAFLASMIPLGYAVKKLDFSNRVTITHSPYFPTAYVYPGFSKNNPKAQQYADMMTNGIRELRKTGRLAKILAAYGVADWSAGK